MNKTKTTKKSKPTKSAPKPAAPSFKSLAKSVASGDKPRGLKIAKNEVGGYTFSYGPKSAPVSLVASADEVVGALLGVLGLKLS